VSGLSGGGSRFRDDDGSADPQAAAALAAFGSGRGSEHAALLALAGSRLLVPVMAAVAAGKASEMALPALVGADGRRAVPAFTSLDALARWRPRARPVPTDARLVWRAAVAESCAVVIDIAGPVPLAVEGARLMALARGEVPPLPHQDPDILAEVTTAVGEHARDARISLGPGDDEGDLAIALTLAVGCDSATASELAGLVGAGVLSRLGGRLRRGVAIAVSPPAGTRPA
jgi:hypothetical protein